MNRPPFFSPFVPRLFREVGVFFVVVLSLSQGCAIGPNNRASLVAGDADVSLVTWRSSRSSGRTLDSTSATTASTATSTPTGGGTLDATLPLPVPAAPRVAPYRPSAGAESAVIMPPAPVRRITVQRGDTLWSIARARNTTVAALRDANDLPTSVIHPGQVLVLP
jgi:LysM repeat protein